MDTDEEYLVNDAPQSKSGDATVGENVEADVADGAEQGEFGLVEMLLIHLQFLRRQKFLPEHGLGYQRAIGALGDERGLDGALIGEISFEKGGVDLDFANGSEVGEGDDAPIISRFAATARFPAIAHVGATTGHQEGGGESEMLVAGGNDVGAVFDGGKIDQGFSINVIPIDARRAVDPQPGDSAIGENVDPDVSERFG